MIPGWLPVVVWLLPLAAALVVGRVSWSKAHVAHGIGVGFLAVATALATRMAVNVVRDGGAFQGPHVDWLDLGSFTLGVGVFVDPMGAIMTVIVCALATLVLAFNAWYMHDDGKAARFPWQFCFFVFAMLGVVLSDNLFLSFCCWELVGLGSYLLIGFWFDKPAASVDPEYQANKNPAARGVIEKALSPAHAQLKAFVMNRVGDAGFLIGIGALLAIMVAAGQRGSVLDYSRLLTFAATAPTTTFLGLSGQSLLILAALGIFCGAIGKSAQFPLHTWLPDAMQGPTTASSIIHAATMVAAGVFLVARCYPMFPAEALTVVGWVGGVTCLLAASIACVQWDLKAVLAYSTVSQLGLMFVGLGAGEENGGRAAGIAHLFTHAIFKCLLFLCAAAVIHAAHGVQDLHRLGGLRKKMPVTAWCSLCAVLAIAGAPLFSGFYSKDAVLAAALANGDAPGGSWGPLVLATAGSLLTAFYMLRWWLRLFAGEARDHHLVEHAHDPSGAAKFVLMAFVPFTLAGAWTIDHWLDRALRAPQSEHLHHAHSTATIVACTVLAVGAAVALFVYWWAPRMNRDVAGALAKTLRPLHTAASELWGIDKLWNAIFANGLGRWLAARCARIDLGSPSRLRALDSAKDQRRAGEWTSVDGVVDGIGRLCGAFGRAGSKLHGGRLSVYFAFTAIVGAAGILWGVLG